MSEPRTGEQEARERLERPARVPAELPREGHPVDEAAGGEDSSPHETRPSGEKKDGTG